MKAIVLWCVIIAILLLSTAEGRKRKPKKHHKKKSSELADRFADINIDRYYRGPGISSLYKNWGRYYGSIDGSSSKSKSKERGRGRHGRKSKSSSESVEYLTTTPEYTFKITTYPSNWWEGPTIEPESWWDVVDFKPQTPNVIKRLNSIFEWHNNGNSESNDEDDRGDIYGNMSSESDDEDSSDEDLWNWRKSWKSSSRKSSEDSSSKGHKHSKGSHKHSKGSKSREHSKGGKKHSHQSSKSKSKSSESKSKSLESKSSGSGSWEDNSWEEWTTSSWCELYCYKWIGISQNFNNIFSIQRISPSLKRFVVKLYCKEANKKMCNLNGTVTENVTTETAVTPTAYTTDRTHSISTIRPEPRSCLAAEDCESDECCAMMGGKVGMACRKLKTNGDMCTTRDDSINVYMFRCPCQEGLECRNSSSQPESLLNRNIGRCRTAHRTTTEVLPTKGRRTTRTGKTTDSGVISTTTIPLVISTTTIPLVVNVTCTDHMDCPFFQCCTKIRTADDTDSGVCQSFSVEGEFCSTLETFSELPIVGACPCQTFLNCRKSNTADVTVNGICV